MPIRAEKAAAIKAEGAKILTEVRKIADVRLPL
jgi:hypothetical protein